MGEPPALVPLRDEPQAVGLKAGLVPRLKRRRGRVDRRFTRSRGE